MPLSIKKLSVKIDYFNSPIMSDLSRLVKFP
jgi:hypothetical protein